MTRTRGLLAVGVVVFLLALALNFPVQKLESRLEASMPGLSLAGISGTLLSGQVTQLALREITLGPASWTFRPQALLKARIEYDVFLGYPDNRLNGRLGVGLLGTMYGKDLDVTLESHRWINYFSPMVIQSSGEFRLIVDTFEWYDGFPQSVSARIDWGNAAILDPVSVVLGNIGAVIQSEADTLVARVDQPGEMGISGNIEFMPGWQYRVDLQLQPGNQISGETLEMLEMVTLPGGPGSYLFQYSGQL